MSNQPQVIEIFLVEDNLADVRLVQEALKDAKLLLNLSVARDGQEALDFLFKREGFQDRPQPDMIILDWNLPKVKGDVVLKEIKTTKHLKRIPVIILSSSQAQEDILRSYDLHANCYVTKPLDFEQFIKIVDTLEEFWFSIVKLPRSLATSEY